MTTELFPFLFSGYFRSVGPHVVSIVSGGWNQSSSTLFYVVFESLYWCVNTVFSAGKSSFPSFLDTYSLSTSFLGCNALCIVIIFLVLWSICSSSSLVHFKNCPEYVTRGTTQVFIHLIRFLQYSFVSSSFLVILSYSLKFFFSSLLIWLCLLPIFLFDYVSFQYS